MIKKINKILLLTSAICGLSSLSYASDGSNDPVSSSAAVVSDFEMKLSAYASFQAGLIKQTKLAYNEKHVTSNRGEFAFFSDAAFAVDASKRIDHAKYGLKMFLVPASKRKGGAMNGAHIYLESCYGKVDLGSPRDAATIMMVTPEVSGSDNADNYIKIPSQMNQSSELSALGINNSKVSAEFATTIDFYLGSFLLAKYDNAPYSNEPSRKVSYYTPKVDLADSAKIQFGISYIPDSSNSGVGKIKESSVAASEKEINNTQKFIVDQNVVDALSAGINIDQSISDGVDLKLGLVGEYGKAAKDAEEYRDNVLYAKHKLKKLSSYGIGAILNIGNFSYSLFYGDLGKSLTTSAYHKTGRHTKYYNGAVMYKQGPFGMSLAYFASSRFKNNYNSITIATDYLVAPGFKPYFEVTTFVMNGKPEYYPVLKKKKIKGTAALVGAKLSL